MDELQKAREQIDRIDREMARLFAERMAAVAEVAAYKQAHGLPVLDAKREEAVIAKNSARVEDEALKPFYVEFLRDTMKTSRHYQRRILAGMTVAFSGIEGAFADAAARRIFPGAGRLACPDFKTAYDSVVSGEADVAVLPTENSTAGEVSQVQDLMFSGPLFVTGMYDFSVTHHLLALPGAKLSDIRRVVSHPQALSQCARFLRDHGFSEEQAENTAIAARRVAEGGDPTVAAIASEETAALYGLEPLARGINEMGINTTRFAVLSRVPLSDKGSDRHFILMFTVRNEAGFLAKAIDVIGRHGYNMRALRSRPMKELLWQYYFYVELEGEPDTPTGAEMLHDLANYCEKLKLLGTFRIESLKNQGT